MPRKDEPRITVRLSADLHERLAARAAEEHVKPGRLVREALEAALGSGPAPGKAAADPAPPRASARRCELDCGRPVPTSLKVSRCQCGGRLVEG